MDSSYNLRKLIINLVVKMRITAGPLEQFESGLARTVYQKPILFDFDVIFLEVVFILDASKEGPESEFLPKENGKGLTLNLYNYGGPHGSGYVDPVKLGTLDSRELWFNFEARRVAPEANAWNLNYFFYYGEKVDE